jgi:hypothetical protein
MRELLASIIAVTGVIIASACSNAADTCAAGTTQICQDASHDNCFCAPPCSSSSDCDKVTAQVEGSVTVVPLTCLGDNKFQVPSLCVPANWQPAQKITISSASASGYLEYGGIDWRGMSAMEATVDKSMPLEVACGAACDAQSGCIAFTLKGNACFLSKDIEDPTPDLTATTFLKTMPNCPVCNYTLQAGDDSPGNDIRMTTESTSGAPGAPVDCARECDSTGGCMGFSMGSGPDAGKCWLKRSIATQSASNRNTYTLRGTR